jgi:Protein of unknown function (DUF1592)/Protein of unknown function (DUF1588)/Protein of unknown function (DUF1595)/Protein of unknown function (DUF1585)/Protein of unknown function (DUF1587)
MKLTSPALASLALAFALPACVGSIGDGAGGKSGPSPVAGPGPGTGPAGSTTPSGSPTPGNSPSTPGSQSGDPGVPTMAGKPGDRPMATPADPNAAGPLPLRRLTRREYNNTVRDLLGDTSRPADSFPVDRDGEFTFRRAGLVAAVDASRIGGAAEALANLPDAKLATILPCMPAAAGEEEGCARTFITNFGQRAYRRPLNNEEIDRHFKLYRDARGAAQLDFRGAIRLLVEAMLQSPNFLYHWELDPGAAATEGKVVRLGPYQMASRLSYALWGSMPDEKLFEAAAKNQLGSEADIEGQVSRMLGDAKARETMLTFFEEWFGFDELADRPKDPKIYPEWKDDLKAAMAGELRAFIDHVVFDGDGKLETLLGANFSFVNQVLAGVYGKTGVTGTQLARTELDPKQRGGLLTLSGWLTLTGAVDGSHPVQRGKMIYERLLCGVLPPPPPDVPEPKAPAPGLTTRERFAEHGQSACAQGCHQHIDALGFAFEHYDGLGKYREMDAGKPVDASGTVNLDGAPKSFNNARELSQLLAGSSEARRCLVTQMARFALGRHDVEADRASIDASLNGFEESGHSLRGLLTAITKSRTFRYRTPPTDEVLP